MGQLPEIKKVLEQLKPELTQKFHGRSRDLFGSVVRDDFSPSSDIDIIVDFDQPPKTGAWHKCGRSAILTIKQ